MDESQEKIALRVKQMDGTEMSFEVKPTETVANIKLMIQGVHEQHVEPRRQRLIHKGRVLDDNSHLGEYSVENNGVIHLVVRPADLPASNRANSAPSTPSPTGQPPNAAPSYIPPMFGAPSPSVSVMSFSTDDESQLGNILTSLVASLTGGMGIPPDNITIQQTSGPPPSSSTQQTPTATSPPVQAQINVFDDVPDVDLDINEPTITSTSGATTATATTTTATSPTPAAPGAAANNSNNTNHNTTQENAQLQQQLLLQQQQQRFAEGGEEMQASLEHAMMNIARLNQSLGQQYPGGIVRHDSFALNPRGNPLLGISNSMWALHRAMHAIEMPLLQLANGTRDLYDGRLDEASRRQILTPEQLTRTSSLLNMLSAACSSLSNSLLLLRLSPDIAYGAPTNNNNAPPQQHQHRAGNGAGRGGARPAMGGQGGRTHSQRIVFRGGRGAPTTFSFQGPLPPNPQSLFAALGANMQQFVGMFEKNNAEFQCVMHANTAQQTQQPQQQTQQAQTQDANRNGATDNSPRNTDEGNNSGSSNPPNNAS